MTLQGYDAWLTDAPGARHANGCPRHEDAPRPLRSLDSGRFVSAECRCADIADDERAEAAARSYYSRWGEESRY